VRCPHREQWHGTSWPRDSRQAGHQDSGTRATGPLGPGHFVIFKNSASSALACDGVWLSKILSKQVPTR
jgi:hypothetical protein